VAGATIYGQVLFGINNIYAVAADGGERRCRIKGKVLRGEEERYNPIAVGDFVELEPDPIDPGAGSIVGRRPRASSLVRWNKKRRAVQVLSANADQLVCVASALAPPFRPRFLDRLLVSSAAGDLEPLIVVNKCDLGLEEATRVRIEAYRAAGYPVVECSALSGQGLERLEPLLAGKLSVFAGQSGVGKSSLLNRLDPGLRLPVGELSSKYDRGVHTTSFARLLRLSGGYAVVDTPGVREFEVAGIRPEELWGYFPEFVEAASRCAYSVCRHREEPGCAVRQAVESGKIHFDRYESYLRIYEGLEEFYRDFYGPAHA
jgi:ribosome biogenesis GTPase